MQRIWSSTVPNEAVVAPGDRTVAEFDLHGIVGIRVVGALPDEVTGVRSQLGPIEGKLARAPDVVIRFADDGPWSGTTFRYVEPREAGFTDDAFLVLRGRRQQQTIVAIPFDEIGERCEIVCRRGTIGVPLLLQIVNMTALARGVLPLHASAFVYRGRCVLVTGWAKGGKSETLLAFAEQGASYIGDEWIYLDPETGMASGIPEPMRLWAWHVRAGHTYQSRIGAAPRAKLRLMEYGIEAAERLLRASRGKRRLTSLIERTLPVVRRQASIQLPPSLLFGESATLRHSVKVDQLVMAMSHSADEVECQVVDAPEVAARMAASLEYERRDLMSSYLAYRFAFPARRSTVLDRAIEIESDMLHRVLRDLPALLLRHPYPVSFDRLFSALASHLAE